MAVEIQVGLGKQFDAIPEKFRYVTESMQPFADMLDKIKASAGEMSKAILAATNASIKASAQAAERSAKAAEDSAKRMEDAAQKQAEAAIKAAERVEKARAKSAEATAKKEAERLEALKNLADQAEIAASRMGATGRSQELLVKIGGQYASVLREAGEANSELEKAWRSGLSPAENSALKLVRISALTEDVRLKTEAFAVATGELSDRMADQIRRQDTNVGSQNKLSRSLSELIDELKAAQQPTMAITLLQAQQADSAAAVSLALKQLAFDTNDADKAGDQYQATVSALQRRLAELEIQEQRTKLATENASEAYGKSKQRLDALESAMEALGIPGANLVTRSKQISDSLETMGEHGSVAQQSMLKAAIAIGGVAAISAAAVAGIGVLAAGIVSLVAQSDEWNQELDKLGLKLDDVGTARVNRAASAVDAAGAGFKAAGVSMANAFAPAVEAGARRMTALGLAAADSFKEWATGEPIMARLARYAATVLTEALFAPITVIAKMGEAFGWLAEQAGFDSIAAGARVFDETVQGWKTDQIDAVSAALEMLGTDAMEPLVKITDKYMVQADAVVKKQGDLNAAAMRNTDAAKQAAKAMSELTKRHSEALPKMESTDDVIGRVAKGHKEYTDQIAMMQSRLESATPAVVDYTEQVNESTQAMQDAGEAAAITSDKISMIFSNVNLGGVANIIDSFKQIEEARSKIDKAVIISGGIGAGLGGIISMLDKVIEKATGSGLLELVSNSGKNAGDVLSKALIGINWSDIMVNAVEGLVGAIGALDNEQLWNNIAQGLAKSLNILATTGVPAIINLAVTMIESLASNLDILLPALINAGIQIGVGLAIAAPRIAIALAEGLVEALVKGVGRAFALFLQAIGLDDKAQAVLDTVNGTVTTTAGGTGTQGTSGGYKEPNPDVVSTDSFIPSSASRKTIQTTPGDSAIIYQDGGKNDPVSVAMQIFEVLLDIRGLLSDQKELMQNSGLGSRGARASFTTIPNYAKGIGR